MSRLCGTHAPAEQVAAAESHFAEHRVAVDTSSLTAADVNLNVYWHVVSKDTTEDGGNVPEEQIGASIDVLNSAYVGTGLQFTLANVTRTVNSEWFNGVGPGNSAQTAMKGELRTGGPADVNIYSVGFASGAGQGLLGYATFPSSYESSPEDDGVVMLYSTTPGGSAANYNGGQTLTHEVGHWVGLYHTFQGGCAEPGDYVEDTAPEAEPVYGCPASSESCGSPDPFNNFMDYTYDACMDEFTPGQTERLQSQMATYRGVSF
ncbi:hypothetical protein BDV98DRAFT_614014 [Pterulicium gracile]|uniref:Peptidase M43 pregnancy-associated plasma-A domain-containing protein n=1 Tax=Pterulicium gracile TaxID=1884261 RepID=A0A5C3QBD7_9AGAR|nr:hypothetical protein BDV98DRAFT_614014 [Pterula gracilis]